MSQKYRYNFDLTVDRECDRYEPRWSSYDGLQAYGDTLEELLENASISIIDQDGGELDTCEADEPWMHELIVEAYWKQNGKTLDSAGKETFNDFVARMEREAPPVGLDSADYDPTPWCAVCGAQVPKACKCGPRDPMD